MMRLGQHLVSGLGEAAGRRMEGLVASGSLRDLAQCAALNARELQVLARADALHGLSGDRLPSPWNAGLASVPALPLAPVPDAPDAGGLVPLSMGKTVLAVFGATGLTLRAHPLSRIRSRLTAHDRGVRADQLAGIRSGHPYVWRGW